MMDVEFAKVITQVVVYQVIVTKIQNILQVASKQNVLMVFAMFQ